MSLCYSCISRGEVILVEKSLGPGNYQDAAKGILADSPLSGNRKTSFPQDDLVYHTMTDNGLVYLCVSNKDMGRRIPYLFLDEVKNRFTTSTSLLQRAQSASAFEFNRDFRKVLNDLMDDFNSGKRDKLSTLQTQVGEVTGVMKQNIEKVLERGDKLDDLVDKSDQLQVGAATFKTTAHRIQRKYFWQNKKMMIIIIVIVIIIVTLIVLFATKTI